MRIGVIDIGSNSIKLLVAERGSTLAARYETTWETRIGQGISRENPELSEEAMERGVQAVKALLEEARNYAAQHYCIVATSAVRDARNREVFIEKIKQATGLKLHVLSGQDEAAYIAYGISTDPALSRFKELFLCDLGGGSLELIHILEGEVKQKTSLQLGAVRLTEECVRNPLKPMTAGDMRRIAERVRSALLQSGFHFNTGKTHHFVGTGGAFTVSRAIRAHWLGKTFEESDPHLSLPFFRYLFLECAALDIIERKKIPNLPKERADILPTALLTIITLAELAHASGFTHSMHNLRYGIAAKMFSKELQAGTELRREGSP